MPFTLGGGLIGHVPVHKMLDLRFDALYRLSSRINHVDPGLQNSIQKAPERFRRSNSSFEIAP